MAADDINGVAIADLSAINGIADISAINGISATIGGGGGGGSWHEIASTASANAGDVATDETIVWDAITLPTGNVTKLGCNIFSFTTGGDIELGLYDSGGNLLVQGTITVASTGDKEVAVASTAVTAGSYYIAKMHESLSNFGVGYDNTTGSADYATGQTPSTLPGTLPVSAGSFTASYTFRAFVE